ncbi:hypothetical protein [Nocardia cyriacigeorgica]|uniref:hypothetical protein n=1 Tax=Nocardia cyriacigeorgica TaxID=135487 RepID=UPI0024920570|nr:hypothetical protein [Nocardia cyriacigeorgica]BDU04512.1 hypothetical protein FMUBM48_07750 [Nocardia cyriacigeorgica]
MTSAYLPPIRVADVSHSAPTPGSGWTWGEVESMLWLHSECRYNGCRMRAATLRLRREMEATGTSFAHVPD